MELSERFKILPFINIQVIRDIKKGKQAFVVQIPEIEYYQNLSNKDEFIDILKETLDYVIKRIENEEKWVKANEGN